MLSSIKEFLSFDGQTDHPILRLFLTACGGAVAGGMIYALSLIDTPVVDGVVIVLAIVFGVLYWWAQLTLTVRVIAKSNGPNGFALLPMGCMILGAAIILVHYHFAVPDPAIIAASVIVCVGWLVTTIGLFS